jgi:hypothetical protein
LIGDDGIDSFALSLESEFYGLAWIATDGPEKLAFHYTPVEVELE